MIQLAGAEAELKSELDIEEKSNTIHHIILNRLNREIGELKEKMRQLAS
ncbi:hypothetical protein GW796_09440 [archaeon]|nr:hypothetical protein [archaeon]